MQVKIKLKRIKNKSYGTMRHVRSGKITQ